jgi:hypothetical protein
VIVGAFRVIRLTGDSGLSSQVNGRPTGNPSIASALSPDHAPSGFFGRDRQGAIHGCG